MRIYQLGKMRKYIDKWTASIIYKQNIVPLFDYADFLIDSGPTYYKDRLSTLHEKAVLIVDCNFHRHANIMDLERYYNLQPPRRTLCDYV